MGERWSAFADTITDPQSLDAARHQAENSAELFVYPAIAIVMSLLMLTSLGKRVESPGQSDRGFRKSFVDLALTTAAPLRRPGPFRELSPHRARSGGKPP